MTEPNSNLAASSEAQPSSVVKSVETSDTNPLATSVRTPDADVLEAQERERRRRGIPPEAVAPALRGPISVPRVKTVNWPIASATPGLKVEAVFVERLDGIMFVVTKPGLGVSTTFVTKPVTMIPARTPNLHAESFEVPVQLDATMTEAIHVPALGGLLLVVIQQNSLSCQFVTRPASLLR